MERSARMRETGRPRTMGGAGQSVERASCWSSADCLLSFCPTFSTTSLTTNHNHSTFVSTLADFDHFQPKWVACTVSVHHNARRALSIGVQPCVAFCPHRRLNPYRRQSSGIAQCIDVPEPDLIALVGGSDHSLAYRSTRCDMRRYNKKQASLSSESPRAAKIHCRHSSPDQEN